LIHPVSANKVAVYRDDNAWAYPPEPPFGPSDRYPEYPFKWPAGSSGDGSIYRLMRSLFNELGLDAAKFGESGWNPLGEFIRPGETVLVKPNWVSHLKEESRSPDTLFVNAAVIRPVLDYVSIALQGRGRIILADAPLQSADFELILKQTQAEELARFWSSAGRPALEIKDLRREVVSASGGDRIISNRRQQGDPEGYRPVNLGLRSYLTPIDEGFRSYRVTNYRPVEMVQHHNRLAHEYLIPNSVLGADTVINLAKLKTHRKGGITCALKNLVGINGSKDWLPHHRAGSAAEGGDEYAHRNVFKRFTSDLSDRITYFRPGFAYRYLWQLRRLSAALARITARDPFTEGSWYGNDTLWRTVLDLFTVMLYADRDGILSRSPVRSHLAVVDAVVAGEGDGPLNASPCKLGMLLAGANPLAVDAAAATLIGHDLRKIPVIARGYELGRGSNKLPLVGFSWQEVELLSNVPFWNDASLRVPEELEGRLDFTPAPGWKSHVELGKTISKAKA